MGHNLSAILSLPYAVMCVCIVCVCVCERVCDEGLGHFSFLIQHSLSGMEIAVRVKWGMGVHLLIYFWRIIQMSVAVNSSPNAASEFESESSLIAK